MKACISLLFSLILWLPTTLPAAQLRDALGREVTVPDHPQRIVSLVPSVTEVLFAIGAGDQLVGVTQFSNYPEAARKLPRVGSYAAPSLEGIAACQPDLVITAADMSDPGLLSRLAELGVPTYVTYPHSIASTIIAIHQLGILVGRQAQAEAVAGQLQQTVNDVAAATAGLHKPRVLLGVEIQPLTVAGPRTLADDLIRAAGGINVVPPGPGRYPTWGIEAVLAADPDIILVSPHPDQPDPAAFFASWPELKAVRNHKVLTIEPDWLHRPGPRLRLGLLALARALHGKDLLPEEQQ